MLYQRCLDPPYMGSLRNYKALRHTVVLPSQNRCCGSFTFFRLLIPTHFDRVSISESCEERWRNSVCHQLAINFHPRPTVKFIRHSTMTSKLCRTSFLDTEEYDCPLIVVRMCQLLCRNDLYCQSPLYNW